MTHLAKFILLTFALISSSMVRAECNSLSVLLLNEYPPLYWIDSAGNPKGVIPKLLDEFAEATKTQVDYLSPRSYFKLGKSIKAKEVDLSPVTHFGFSEEFEQVGPVYYRSQLGFFALEGAIQEKEVLKQSNFYKTVAVNITPSENSIDEFLSLNPTAYRYGNIEKYINRLDKGILSGVLADRSYFGLINKMPLNNKIALSQYSLGTIDFRFAFRKGFECTETKHAFSAFLTAKQEKNIIADLIDEAYLEYFY